MRKYSDYKKKYVRRRHPDELKPEEFAQIKWPQYKIVVPTEDDRQELQDAFEHLHNTWGIDTDIIAVNQLCHEYLTEEREPGSKSNIIVDPEMFKLLTNPIE